MLLEPLEHRRLFSVTVTEAYPGFYEVTGTEGDDVAAVTVSMADESFTLDGNTYTGAYYLFVNTFGGDDQVSLISLDGSGIIGASVSTGDGNDSVVLNFDGAVWGDGGNDAMYLADSFRGEVYGGAGADSIYISGACVDAEIHGGDGNDLIDCSANDYSVTIRAGGGDDTMIGSAYSDVLHGGDGTDSATGGGGSDCFHNAETIG